MLYSEIMAVCSEIHTKHINTLCGQNVEFVNVKEACWGNKIQLQSDILYKIYTSEVAYSSF
jgi:hypothetical protein